MSKDQKSLPGYYRRQAKHLIKDVRSGEAWLETGALDRIQRVRGVERASSPDEVRLGDCQEVVAAEAGVDPGEGGWRKFVASLDGNDSAEEMADEATEASEPSADLNIRYLPREKRVRLSEASAVAVQVEHDIDVAAVHMGEPGDGYGGLAPLQHRISFVPSQIEEFPWDLGALDDDEWNTESDRVSRIYKSLPQENGSGLFGQIQMDEFPVRLYGAESDWSFLFDMRDRSPHTEQGFLVNALLHSGHVPMEIRQGGIFYIHNLGIYYELVEQGLAEHMLEHLMEWLSFARSGLIIADPKFMWHPVLGVDDRTETEYRAALDRISFALRDVGFEHPSPDVIDMGRFDSSAMYSMI